MEIFVAIITGLFGMWIGMTMTVVWEIKKIVKDIRKALVGY